MQCFFDSIFLMELLVYPNLTGLKVSPLKSSGQKYSLSVFESSKEKPHSFFQGV